MSETAYLFSKSTRGFSLLEEIRKDRESRIEGMRRKYHHPSTPQGEKDAIENILRTRFQSDVGDPTHYTASQPTARQAGRGGGGYRPPPRPNAGGGGYRPPPPGGGGFRPPPNFEDIFNDIFGQRRSQGARGGQPPPGGHSDYERNYRANSDNERMRFAREAGERQARIQNDYLRRTKPMARKGVWGQVGHKNRAVFGGTLLAAGAGLGGLSYASMRNKRPQPAPMRYSKSLKRYTDQERRGHRRDSALAGAGLGTFLAGGFSGASGIDRKMHGDDYKRWAREADNPNPLVRPRFSPGYNVTADQLHNEFNQAYRAQMPTREVISEAHRTGVRYARSGKARMIGGAVAAGTGLGAVVTADRRMANRERDVRRRLRATGRKKR